jgi:hypothetical protein
MFWLILIRFVPESYTNKCDFLMLGNLAPAVQMRVIDQMPNRVRKLGGNGYHEFLDEYRLGGFDESDC